MKITGVLKFTPEGHLIVAEPMQKKSCPNSQKMFFLLDRMKTRAGRLIEK